MDDAGSPELHPGGVKLEPHRAGLDNEMAATTRPTALGGTPDAQQRCTCLDAHILSIP